MLKEKNMILLFCILLFTFGCETTVLRQDIPVSTNPMGASMFADGKPVGQTPGTVSLERNRDHILTLVKENYRQEDVIVTKQYQSDKVLMKAVQSGINSGLFFKDTRMGVNSGFGSISHQEASGEAYILVPPAVQVNLVPLSGPSRVSVGSEYPAGHSVADSRPPSGNTGFTSQDIVKAGVVAGAAIVAAQVKPIEKKWETSSSSKSYIKPDGTRVTEKSSTSVGVKVNPVGLVNALDILFK